MQVGCGNLDVVMFVLARPAFGGKHRRDGRCGPLTVRHIAMDKSHRHGAFAHR